MLSLHKLQRSFCDAVLSGHADLMTNLIRDNGIPGEERIRIYRNNSRLGFLATMRATFPVVERLGGTDWFEENARQYQLRYPSRCGDLQFVGRRYSKFLEEGFSGTNYAYFVDIAALEWAYQEVLIAADSAPFDPAQLGTVATDDYAHVVFTVCPSLRLVESPYPILAIWKANQTVVDASAAAIPDIRLDAGPSRTLLIRRADHVELRDLPPARFALLQAFSRGIALGDAADAVGASFAEFDLGVDLRELMLLETIADFHVGGNDAILRTTPRRLK